MKLVLATTREDVIVGRSYKIVAGVHANMKGEDTILVQKIVEPSEQQPRGLILTHVTADGGLPSRQEYVPSVIGAEWQEEQLTNILAAEAVEQLGEQAA